MKNISNLSSAPLSIISLLTPAVDQLRNDLIKTYKQVFGDEIWSEGLKCQICNNKFPFPSAKSTPPPDQCCGVSLVDYYSDEEVGDMIDQVTSNTYFCLFLLLNGTVQGFSWGWKTTMSEINRQKLKLTPEQLISLEKKLSTLAGQPINNLYYQSETGVISSSRGQGWAGRMIDLIDTEVIKNAATQQLQGILQRTSRKSPMFNLRTARGYQLVFEYKDPDQRVLFFKPLVF